MDEVESTKFCLRCETLKLRSEFYVRRASRDGLMTYCKDCSNAYNEWYRREHREKRNAQIRSWNERNRSKVEKARKDYRESEEGRLAVRVVHMNWRLRQRGVEGTLNPEDVRQMLVDQGGLCAYCEVDITESWTIDHIIAITRGGTNDWSNVALVCFLCNTRKSARSVESHMRRLMLESG